MATIPRGSITFPPRLAARALRFIARNPIRRGPEIEAFEKAFAGYTGARHAVSVGSGKIALYCCMKALGIAQGDEIVLPSFIVAEVVDMVICAGGRPVFVDVDPETMNLSVEHVEQAITARTRCILAPHMYGQPCDLQALAAVASARGIEIIEDCAQACGAWYMGRKVGSVGIAATYSFGLMKNLNALGGGMVTCNDAGIAEAVRRLREPFACPPAGAIIRRFAMACLLSTCTHPTGFGLTVYPVLRVGGWPVSRLVYRRLEYSTPKRVAAGSIEELDHRLGNLQAAIGRWQLEDLDRNNDRLRANAAALERALEGSGIDHVRTIADVRSVPTSFVVRVPDRRGVAMRMLRDGIDVSNGYVQACSALDRFAAYRAPCPVSEALAEDNLYLPVSHLLSEEHMTRIASSLVSASDRGRDRDPGGP